MQSAKPIRVMWLLNHTSARKFELAMLKAVGFNEIFLPKIIPSDPGFRSASIEYSYDQSLTIPAEDLEFINSINWYEHIPQRAIDIANQHFDILFFIVHDISIINTLIKKFKGVVIWRMYGLVKTLKYSELIRLYSPNSRQLVFSKKGRSFFSGIAYDHLLGGEDFFLQNRQLYLPLGLVNSTVNDVWRGIQPSIFFVCPDIGFNPYYKNVYQEFKDNLGDLPYVIAGAQPISIKDKNVLGFVSKEQYTNIMQDLRVMFYQSQEPNHVHYHPFEAIQNGMPLVFMAGGLLDKMGGVKLLGRCKTYKEARKKIIRILNGDKKLIESIRNSQTILLQKMSFDYCLPYWKEGMMKAVTSLKEKQEERLNQVDKGVKQKIAIIVPVPYKGGSLRGSLLLANTLVYAQKLQRQDVEIIYCHLAAPDLYTDEDFYGLDSSITRRSFTWDILDYEEANRAMNYAGVTDWVGSFETYQVPNDGMKQLMECDVWLLISDRSEHPILPIKPTVLMIYDYLQRYHDVIDEKVNCIAIQAARMAEQIWVTTKFTYENALQYAGVEEHKVHKMPMLAPIFQQSANSNRIEVEYPYFIWTTNLGRHKNHIVAIQALKIYYMELEGKLKCHVTGVNTHNLIKKVPGYLTKFVKVYDSSKKLKNMMAFMGELDDAEYRQAVINSCFLWHPAQIDNGTFSVIEAASLNVVSLSSDYPAMREINQQFELNLTWADPFSAKDMAAKLKYMEQNYIQLKKLLPTPQQLAKQSVEEFADYYWETIAQCL